MTNVVIVGGISAAHPPIPHNTPHVRQGYKQTEVGVIPEDWDVKRLGELCVTYSGGTPPTSNREYYDGDIPWITSSDLNQGSIESVDGRITLKGLENSSAKMVDEGVLLVALYGATAGVTAITHIKGAINQAILAVIPKSDDTSFIYHHLSFRKEWVVKTFTQGGQPNLSAEIVKSLPIPIPETTEQRAIATALSDVDALLAAQDKLIAKKRDIKQAAMQQLLTGKQRLPGFNGEWEVKRLGNIAAFYKGKGLAKNELDPYGSEPCIHYGELFTRHPETISKILSRTNTTDSVFRSVANDVLMPTSDVTPNGLARASCVQQTGIVLGGDILVIRANPKEVNGSFLSYVIRQMREQVMQLVSGTTVFHLYGTDMKKFEFIMPSIEEQQAIVKILDDMDADLAALERQRDKTRALKQGMMQELLTGRIRLV